MEAFRGSIAEILRDAACRGGYGGGLEADGLRINYPTLERSSSHLAHLLRGAGIGRDDVVAWIGDNTPGAALAYFGAAWAGVVLAPLHLRLRDDDLRGVMSFVGAKAILVESSQRERARGFGLPLISLDLAVRSRYPGPHAVAVRPSDPAHLYATSGSTGVPKVVVLTHGNVTAHARLAVEALGLSSRDVWLHAAPMFHLADAWATFAVTLVRGTHRFVPKFEAGAVLDAFERGVTTTNLVPTMWDALVREPSAAGRRFPALRLLLSGGAPIAPDLVGRIRSTFRAEYAQTYGLTETSPYLTISRLSPADRALPEDEICRLLARAGHPMLGVDVRVVDAAGRDVPADDAAVGEVVARGPTVTPGYWMNPEATEAAIRDLWFHTGDLARVDPTGRIDLVDRTKDVVNTGGEKVFSIEVERALASLAGVREVAVLGAPDAHWGEVVAAVVVPEGPAGAALTLESVQAHVRARLADFKVPRRLLLVDALPRTASGKIFKRALRDSAPFGRAGEQAW